MYIGAVPNRQAACLHGWRTVWMLGILVGLTQMGAAETARYQVTFDATWSAASHPVDFPANPHFSGLIGGTHRSGAQFWAPGMLATDGIESMAETGSKTLLETEVRMAIDAGEAERVISGGGIGTSPDTRREEFEITAEFPLVTLVSMIAPSPDWFVGVHDFDLRANGEWVGQVTVPLVAYDAGTDDGSTFTSPDADTQPRQPIAELNQFPFEGTGPLGSFTFLRILTGDYSQNGLLDAADLDQLSAAIRAAATAPEYDLNADGMVGPSDRLFWVRNLRGTVLGDANLDGRFDSSDLILVSQAGEYEDSMVGNSSWATGDWSGDGEFDSLDLIVALQAGGYEPSSGAVAAVPEPTSWALVMWLLPALWCGIRSNRLDIGPIRIG